MKKIILLTSILALCAAFTAIAGPAYPGRIVVTQPDGSTIGIRLHGDEFGHWATDDAGNIVEQGEDGFWRVSNTITRNTIEAIQEAAAVRRAAAGEAYKASAGSSANFGSPKIPVILVGFKDKEFSKTNAQFTAMLNTPGYSENNAIGSVWDYFNENSHGQFTPVFEVLGPVTLDNEMSYYGRNTSSQQGSDEKPEMALVHAAQKLDSSVDFSRYDNNHDGVVDFVMFYYAGFDEAQSGITNNIWSHAWYLSSSSYASSQRTFDSVKLDRYFCTAELKGYTGSTMCSIGTTCHEFAHTLGLPDFYDSNGTTNGSAANMYDLDLMASGSYNGDSTTPPYLNAEEVTEIGWMSDIPELSTSGSVTLSAVNYPNATNYSAYMTKTSVSNEYFVYECRGGQRWDASIPTGLLVYHVDKSSNVISGSITAYSVWSSNKVNAYSAHPCCYVVPASNPTSTAAQSGSMSSLLFGRTVKSFSPVEWSGKSTGFQLSNIVYANGEITFNVVNSNAKGISGIVTNSDGYPLAGVTISISPVSSPSAVSKSAMSAIADKIVRVFKPSSRKLNEIKQRAASVITTDNNGNYSIDLSEGGDYSVTASLSGYQSKTATLTVSRYETLNFSLLREGESLPSELFTFPDNAEFHNYGNTDYDEWPMLFANIYPSSFLSSYAGKQIKTISFLAGGTSIENCHVVIDYGSTRKLALPIEAPVLDEWTTVDVIDQELFIPSGEDVFVGYGGDIYGNYPIWASVTEDSELIGYMGDFSLSTVATTVNWEPWSGQVFAIRMTVGDYEAPDTGYNYIADPKSGAYSSGDVFEFNLVQTSGDRKPSGEISWYFDEEPVSAQSVTLTTGPHLVEAHFTTSEGKTKVVELEINVE